MQTDRDEMDHLARTHSMTRRNLFAAMTVLVSALGTKLPRAWGDPARDFSDDAPWAGGRSHCYLRGTRIRTPNGEREVSELQIGNLVTTHSADAKPIKWIGRRRVTRTGQNSWPADAVPIKVARFALDAQTPSADLYLSPGHALYLDGLLITAGSLVNGHSIAPCVPIDAEVLEYFHIELFAHEVIFADGAPTETLLLPADRKGFDNWAEYDALYKDETVAVPFAPIISMGRPRLQFRSRLRSALSPWVDRRQPCDVIRDRIEDRAEQLILAA
jgi:hypothetical protein